LAAAPHLGPFREHANTFHCRNAFSGKEFRKTLTAIPFWNKVDITYKVHGQNIPRWYNSMWKIKPSDEFEKRAKKWPKKFHREMAAMLANVKTMFDALCLGAKVEHLRYGFLHHEPAGVLAVDQKGGGSGLKESRLYTFPDKEREDLHLITVGDKNTQAEDVAYCKDFATGIKG
jgi:hypothetical protein